ncbi:MAG: type II toxin-antitoxin system VapC family toxin [Rhodospirillaceae bacterium]|nr:type II toxin-antitoxin system VapC family toxin [Rhodospirillaceae bacterium]
MPMLNLDTHILIFAVNGALRPAERRLLAKDRWSISAIVLWEIAKLARLGRIEMELDDRDVARVLNRVHVWPIDLDVARTSVRLDFEGDPADGIIAATSIVHGVPLVTRDRTIRRSKIVPLATAAAE